MQRDTIDFNDQRLGASVISVFPMTSLVLKVKLSIKQDCKQNSAKKKKKKTVDPVTLAPLYLGGIMFINMFFPSFEIMKVCRNVNHFPNSSETIFYDGSEESTDFFMHFTQLFKSLLPALGYSMTMFLPLSSSCVMYLLSVHSWIPSLSTPLHSCILLFCLTCWVLCVFLIFLMQTV